MSTAAASTRPASRPEHLHSTATVREFSVVEGRRPARSLLALALLSIAVIIAAMLGSMILHTRMAETSFAIREQQVRLNELDAEAWAMQDQIEKAASPSSLQNAAKNAGMVPAGETGFITLSSGQIEGGVPAR